MSEPSIEPKEEQNPCPKCPDSKGWYMDDEWKTPCSLCNGDGTAWPNSIDLWKKNGGVRLDG